jgi:hypothetical protein
MRRRFFRNGSSISRTAKKVVSPVFTYIRPLGLGAILIRRNAINIAKTVAWDKNQKILC